AAKHGEPEAIPPLKPAVVNAKPWTSTNVHFAHWFAFMATGRMVRIPTTVDAYRRECLALGINGNGI
ncbi:hypothetical protein, partial [Terracidiphilus sp.]|uniref:hypothetical protein n=1 Tax=Terracidiphilus sp. TaxID=1964191 RepID=UPI003C24929D